MARTREFNPDSVVDCALDLFWRKGYKACSMAEVVKKTGVARYGLYQAFKDKDQLYCATLKRYKQKIKELFAKPFTQQPLGFESLVNHFNLILEQLEIGEHQGCFAHQAAIERGAVDDNVNQIVKEIFADSRKGYQTVLEAALHNGEVRPMPIEDLVNFVMGIQRALIAMSKQNCSLEERRNYVRCSLALLRNEQAPQIEGLRSISS